MNNLDNWEKLSRPPAEALKTIKGGRLGGMTDINPQWRYKAMTEVFGPCGDGWTYDIVRLWTEPGTDGQVCVFAHINLFVGQHSPIPGIGGSMLVAKEREGLRTNDEAYKMAITDALSVAMKMLGVGADIYMGRWDGSKYREPIQEGKGVIKPTDGAWEALDEETKEWMRRQAMSIIYDIERGRIEQASDAFYALGLDPDNMAAFWTLFDSRQRAYIDACRSVKQAQTLDALKNVWDACPKYAKDALVGVKDSRKEELGREC